MNQEILKSSKLRIYPTNSQQQIIEDYFSCISYVTNYLIEYTRKRYKENLKLEPLERYLTIVKELYFNNTWIKQYMLSILESNTYTTYKYLKKVKEKLELKNIKKFKVLNHLNNISFNHKYVSLSLLGDVKTRNKSTIKGQIMFATIEKDKTCRYYICLTYKFKNNENISYTNKKIGLDLGIKDLIVTSDGVKYKHNYIDIKYIKNVKNYKKKLSKKTIPSKKRDLIKKRLAQAENKIKRIRHDNLHKITTKIVKENDVICIEDLNVAGLIKMQHNPSNLLDSSLQVIKKMLEYKSKLYGKKLIKVDRYFPSSIKCSNCNYIHNIIKDTSYRTWLCPKCKVNHDRDINAAINILNQGIKIDN